MSLSPLERKIALLKKGVTLQSIADALDISLVQVSAVNLGNRRSPRVEAAIAAAIDTSVARAFPPVPATTRRPKAGAA